MMDHEGEAIRACMARNAEMLEALYQAQPQLLMICRWPTGWKRRCWRMLLVSNIECIGVQSFKVARLSLFRP